MQKLISELTRLYLAPGMATPDVLQQQLLGKTHDGISLVAADDTTRAVAIAFRKMAAGEQAQHWNLLCSVANALQAELALPAPAVSISGADGFHLWLSLEHPTPVAQVRQFVQLLRNAYFSDIDIDLSMPALPPCLNSSTGKWAAFIHPGLGASFADESGLEMAPPFAGQAALLESLHSIGQAQLGQAMNALAVAPPTSAPAPDRASVPQGLLLKDATLEDIVNHLHAKNIEPTFRHLLRTRAVPL